jgi:hypothetical protein
MVDMLRVLDEGQGCVIGQGCWGRVGDAVGFGLCNLSHGFQID